MSSDRMTAAERMRALTNKQPIDRTPVVSAASLYNALLVGQTAEEYYLNPEKALEASLWAMELHGHDDSPSYNIPGGAGWDFGGELVFPKGLRAAMPVLARKAVSKESDVERLTLPDLNTAPCASRLREFGRLARKLGYPVSIPGGSPTGVAGLIVEVDLLMRWFIKAPELAHRVYRLATDYILAVAEEAMEEFGADNLSVFATYPFDSHAMISPRIFRKFALPYVQEIHTKLLARGVNRWRIHLCADHTKNLECWRSEIPLAPRTAFQIGHEMDTAKVSAFFGGAHIVSGNVQTDLLLRGTPEQVLQECRRQIEHMKDQPGGFVLSPACGLPPETPPANVHAMVKAARLYGACGFAA